MHQADGHVFVRYRNGIVLRVPRAATSLLSLGRETPCDRLCRSAAVELLALVKEYESCPKIRKVRKTPRAGKSPRAKFGPRSRPKSNKKSPTN
jgi:hypothetical protein